MNKKGKIVINSLIVFLAIAIVFFFAIVKANPDTYINSCQVLNNDYETYILTSNVGSSSVCFTVQATDITLDCNGYSIEFASSINGIGASGIIVNADNFKLKNCVINQGSTSTQNMAGIHIKPSADGTNLTGTVAIYVNVNGTNVSAIRDEGTNTFMKNVVGVSHGANSEVFYESGENAIIRNCNFHAGGADSTSCYFENSNNSYMYAGYCWPSGNLNPSNMQVLSLIGTNYTTINHTNLKLNSERDFVYMLNSHHNTLNKMSLISGNNARYGLKVEGSTNNLFNELDTQMELTPATFGGDILFDSDSIDNNVSNFTFYRFPLSNLTRISFNDYSGAISINATNYTNSFPVGFTHVNITCVVSTLFS